MKAGKMLEFQFIFEECSKFPSKIFKERMHLILLLMYSSSDFA